MEVKQARAFQRGEGDAWFERNRDKLKDDYDPVVDILEQLPFVKPKNIIEIGCADGHRLARLGKLYGISNANLFGIEPSSDARVCGYSSNGIVIDKGTADKIAYNSNIFDMVIFGFCLYLVDREDLFKAVSEADRILKDNGHLVILDFIPPMTPYKVPYKHRTGLWSYHMDYSKLFLANPAYRMVMGLAGEDRAVDVLQKKMELAYPEGEL